VIDRVLAAARGRADAADAMWQTSERMTVSFEAGRLKAVGVVEEAGVNLRIVRRGHVGVAGTTRVDAPPADLVERALASAALGEEVALAFPGPAAPPAVATADERAAALPLDGLIDLGRALVERLTRERCQVNVAVERAVSRTAVGSSAGARGSYAATAVSVSADVTRIAGDDVLMVYDYCAASAPPTAAELDALVESITTRLERALTIVAPPGGGRALPVIFTPAGLAAILLPLEHALSGKTVLQGSSPLAGKLGATLFDERFSLTDDPLAPGRPGSRPLDDEGVPSTTLPLVERGVVRHFIYDLETAARAGARSTGHGHRGVFGKPQAGYTNLILGGRGTGDGGRGTLGGGLLDGIRDGLVVDDLIGVGQGNVAGGAFSHPVALAYRVERGEITGRVKDAAVAGNAYELLKRIGGFGTDGRWLGSRFAPSLLLDGVSVARR
jgi:PmbA protein